MRSPAPGGPIKIIRTPSVELPEPPASLFSSSAIRASSRETVLLSSSTTVSVIGAIVLVYVKNREGRGGRTAVQRRWGCGGCTMASDKSEVGAL